MREVICIIRGIIEKFNKEYYLIKEKETDIEHIIPKYKIETFKNIKINKSYTFLETLDSNHKSSISITHQNFKINSEVTLRIIKEKIKGNNEYFELESDFIKPLEIRAFPWQKKQNIIKCKVVGYRNGFPILKNIDTTHIKWNIDDIVLFEIDNFDKILDKNGKLIDVIKLRTEESQLVTVKTQNWQKKENWPYRNIRCKIIGINQKGLPKLITYDNRHPQYQINEEYDFIVNGFKKVKNKNKSDLTLIILTNNNNDQFQVPAFPAQETKLIIGNTIKCRVKNISTRIELSQPKQDDPFFYEFESIIPDPHIKNEYLLKYLKDDENSDQLLKTQYQQKSAFWVFTYCNSLLKRIKQEALLRRDYEEAIKIIDLLNKVESWIISSGILNAIKDSEERKLTKNKSNQIIKKNNHETFSLKTICNFKALEFFEKQEKDLNLIEIYYFIKYSIFETLSEKIILKLILNIKKVNPEDIHILKQLLRLIDKQSQNYNNSFYNTHFILIANRANQQSKELKRFLTWLFIQIKITEISSMIEEGNILISKFYRLNTILYSNNLVICRKLLLNAFNIISNPEIKNQIPIKIEKDELIIQIDKLPDNFSKQRLKNTDKILKAKITTKHYKGYKADIDNTIGFLPIQNITDQSLRRNQQDNIEWEINAELTLYSSEFNYFVCKQTPLDSKNYYSNNLKETHILTQGEIHYAIIKNITVFNNDLIGIFISTHFGDGLIIEYDISNKRYSLNELKALFKEGDKIPTYFLNYTENGKMNFGLKQLIGTKYDTEYFNLFNTDDQDSDGKGKFEENNYLFKIEIEKGFIFEQFAVFKESIQEKIKYIKFAKAFFSNTNNARSYLLNIYVEYFNSIIELDKLIINYSFNRYEEFRIFINKIRQKVEPKTIENFPESKNLIFFIDILSLFNSKVEQDLEPLFELVRKSINENEISIKAVAKTVLSNNLIITELSTNEKDVLDEYTLKNLKLIRKYIGQGVLSISESEEDTIERELREKRKKWKQLISDDEGEKLEFKATFKTPVPNKEQDKIIKSLQKQIDSEIDQEKIKRIEERIGQLKFENENAKGIEDKIIHSALKTICAFSNTNGGCLLLGVSDDKRIYGLQQDYLSFKKDKGRDEFGKFFDSKIKEYFGESFSSSLLEKEFLAFPEGDILIINVKASKDEIFLLRNEFKQKEECIYVRNLSSSERLSGIELAKFLKTKFRNQLK